MLIAQRTVSTVDMAQAMLGADAPFAQRVRQFEERFGRAEPAMLGVLAQAAYFCWGNHEYRQGLLQVCRAIGASRPTSFYYHAQVTPQRWDEVNTYLTATRHWLGCDIRPPSTIAAAAATRIGEWLGERCPAKEALAELFLSRLAAALAGTRLAVMGHGPANGAALYQDYREWYVRRDGAPSLAADRPHFEAACQARARAAMSSSAEDAEALIAGIVQGSPPPCCHRFCRYLDIQLSSIGVLRWRGNLPLDVAPVSAWEAYLAEARAALEDWANGAQNTSELARWLAEALGPHAAARHAIVREFLLADARGSAAAWDWLVSRSTRDC